LETGAAENPNQGEAMKHKSSMLVVIGILLFAVIANAQTTEDCVSFNPATTTVANMQNNWLIVDGTHSMFSFGANQAEARQTLAIIKHYGMNQSCFVGRPGPSFTYMLVSGRAPSGTMTGEDCLPFNATNASVAFINNDWKIVDGNRWMFSFGANQAEARQTLAIIKKYNFNSSCFVGRPGPSFTYMKASTVAVPPAVQQPVRPVTGPILPHTPPLAPVKPVATAPDLQATRVWIAQYVPPASLSQYTPLSGNAKPGQEVYLVCEFQNGGGNLKGSWRVSWQVDGKEVYTTRFGDIEAGGKRNPGAKYVMPAPGMHRLECVLDPDGQVAESNETNNRTTGSFQVATATAPGSTGSTSTGSSSQGSTPAAGAPTLSSLTPTGTLVNGRLYVNGTNFGSLPGSTVVIRLQSGEQFTGTPDDVTTSKFSMGPVPNVYQGYNVTAKNNEHRARIQQVKTLYVKKGTTESNKLSFNIRSPYPILDQVYNPTGKPGDLITVRGGNYEPAKIAQYTAVFEYLPGRTIQTKLMPYPAPTPPIPFPFLNDVTMVGNFLIKVPDVFAGKSQADQDAINRYTGTVAIFGPGTGQSNKLSFGFRKQTSASSSTTTSTGTTATTGSAGSNTCQAGKYISGMTYVGRPGCATRNRADHPSAYIMCDAEGFYCCESSQGANTKCGANRWIFQPDCGNFCGVGGCDVQLIQPYGCYRSNPR
jgi:hypothetical protein